jgi:uroporphyrinogen-III synthase
VRPCVAAFRPADGRLARAGEWLSALGAEPVLDPMLTIEPTGATPAPGERVVFTSRTGARLADDAGWAPGTATVCAIGPKTAAALRERGYDVALVPEDHSSAGLVAALEELVADEQVTVARSDHGSDVLLDGLRAAGAAVTETVLYRLGRPSQADQSVSLAADGALDGVCFTSSLTVEHFCDAAAERERRAGALDGLDSAVVGVIGEPTRRAAEAVGISVDVVPENTTFEAVSRAVISDI